MWGKVEAKFGLPELKSGRQRRNSQLSWTTFVKEWRGVEKGRKRAREPEEEDADAGLQPAEQETA